MAVEVYVVQSHNPTSGKGSYRLDGVKWSHADAETFILTLAKAPDTPRVYRVHRFIEQPTDAPMQISDTEEEIQAIIAEIRQAEVDGLNNMHYLDACDAIRDRLRKGRG